MDDTLLYKHSTSVVYQHIFLCNMKGYQPDELEEWEDASYIVYQVTDRYGFMQ